mmetsp:Transcript_84698/g.226143  ORF Transcript_84698/g.226143 Transcript_84698/m.226143 type:complete len:106 (-) Transcript_84698:119-436(-)
MGSEDSQLVSCSSAFDAMWFCFSPANQFKKYYREGTYDECEVQQRVFSLCMQLRYREVNGKGDDEAARKIKDEMIALSSKSLKDHVWKFKPPPAKPAEETLEPFK